MRRLTEPVYARVIEDPTSYEQFRTFRCGDPETSRSALEVQTTARKLYAGEAAVPHVPVVVEEASGELIAFCTVYRYPQRHLVPEAYITAFGRSEDYRGCFLRDGTTTPGRVALLAGLDMIALAWAGQAMPQVWARVLRGNERSHSLFDELGFLNLGAIIVARSPGRIVREDQQVRLLAAEVPLPPAVSRDVYVPPMAPRRPLLPAPAPAPVLVPGSPRTALPPLSEFDMQRVGGILARRRKQGMSGRNDPCWCGSGKKLKKCHGA